MTDPISDTLTPVRQTAAQVLAAAVCDLFPGTHLAGGQGTDPYFYYDFHFPFPFQPEMLSPIEERMRAILRENRPIVSMEMVPMNAADLMRHQKQPLVEERLRLEETATVQMCKIGTHADFCPHAFAEHCHLRHFKLLEGIVLDGSSRKGVRIVGALTEEKTDLKAIAKLPLPSKKAHLPLAYAMKLFEPVEGGHSWIWLPQALVLRNLLCKIWEQECVKQNIHRVSTPYAFLQSTDRKAITAHFEALKHSGMTRAAELSWVQSDPQEGEGEGLLGATASYSDRVYLISTGEKLLEETISFLQFILKIPKILGFEFEIVLSVSCAGNQGKRKKVVSLLEQALRTSELEYAVRKVYSQGEYARIEVMIPDALGRKWSGPFLCYPELSRETTCGEALVLSTFGSMERLFALLLENTGGSAPFEEVLKQLRELSQEKG
ncbi:MAG: hypothetical protein V4492_09470 [Chlamydiota bacterium]